MKKCHRDALSLPRYIQAVATYTAIPTYTDIQVYTCHILRYTFSTAKHPAVAPRPPPILGLHSSRWLAGLTAECRLLLSLIVYHNRAPSFRRLFSNFFSRPAFARAKTAFLFRRKRWRSSIALSLAFSGVTQNDEEAAGPPIFSHLSLRMKK